MLANKKADLNGLRNVDITYSSEYTRLSSEEVESLYQFIKLTSGDALELGRLYGGSTKIILQGLGKNQTLTSVDLYNKPLKAFSKHEEYLLDKLFILTGDSNTIKLGKKFETVFIDTNHSYQNLSLDLKNCWKHVDKYFLFHDYRKPTYEAEGVKKVVDYLINSKKLKLISLTQTLIITEKNAKNLL